MVAFSSNYFHFFTEQTYSFCLQKTTLSEKRFNIIHYIKVDFTFGLPDYVQYIEEFVISRFYSIHFTVTLAGT